MTSIVHNADCLAAMREMPDKAFDLAIVDPPYFEDYGKKNYTGNDVSTTGVKRQTAKIKHWSIPDENYFQELFRVSKHQIIWGCNYYAKHIPHFGRIIWDKKNDTSTFSKAEIASKSQSISVDMFRFEWNGMLQENMSAKETRIHPTQKPVALYQWLLKNYAKAGWHILDTHVGSGSSRIACDKFGCHFTGYEIDKDYWEAQEKRYADYKAQPSLFAPDHFVTVNNMP